MYLHLARRVQARPFWLAFAFRAGRGRLAILLAGVPAILLGLLMLLTPSLRADAVTQTFARYISGLITAATIAVGFATLTLGRGIKGVGELRQHAAADREYADAIEAFIDGPAPIGIGATLARVLDATEERAKALGETDLADHARGVAHRVRHAGGDPNELLLASLDLDVERALHEARTRVRDAKLIALLEAAHIGRSYVKTLATQWSISRMSQGIALSSLVAVIVATGVVLGFDEGHHDLREIAILTLALFLVLLPLAIFVSFTLRLTFLHQHSLPLGHFVLGPEDPRAAEDAGGAWVGTSERPRRGAGP